MNLYYLIADMFAALSLFGLAYMAHYRIIKQGEADPALKHLRFVMYSCLVAGVGHMARNVCPPMAVVGAAGLLCLFVTKRNNIQAIIHQPTLTDVQVITARVAEVAAKMALLLDPPTDETR